MMTSLRVVGLWCGCLLLGCVADPADESLGEVDSGLNMARWVWSWGTTDGPTHDLGPANDRTCFLAGVAGNLNAGWGWDHPGSPSEASVEIVNGRWILTATGGHDFGNTVIGNPVNAHVVCIGTVAGRLFGGMGGNGGSVNQKVAIAPITATRQCLLNEVSGFSGSWFSGAARLRLLQENGNWVLESANIGVAAGIPRFSAVCFDLPVNTWVGTGFWGVGNPGSATASVGFEGGVMACGLNGIQGPLSFNDWNDGAMITWPAVSPGTWTMSLKNGKTGFVTCMQ